MRQLLLVALFVAVLGCKGGDMAPNVSFEKLDEPGKKLDLEGFRGKVVLMDFWATWCGPCRESMPAIAELHRKYSEKGLQIVAVSDESRDVVGAFAKEVKLPYAFYLDPTGGEAARAYGVEGIPHTVIIDKSGKIVFEGHPMDTAQVEAAIERAL